MQRLLPPILLILTWVGMIALDAVWPLAQPFPAPVRVVGGMLAALGIFLTAKSKRIFRQIRTNVMTFDKPDTLVTTGPFAWSRNPMYLGFAICALGGAVALNAASALGLAVLFCVTLDLWYVRFEEKMMSDTFGRQFDDYRNRVRRWL